MLRFDDESCPLSLCHESMCKPVGDFQIMCVCDIVCLCPSGLMVGEKDGKEWFCHLKKMAYIQGES